ncbi:MAG TPA: nuclear transport factor 2 family protein [Acidimicrobiales bacterium]|nr:nuclear transport factor 2 family protein [Acidimicrobiales bacterium]
MGAAQDRLDVIELIHRYAALVDFKTYDDADQVFTKDAVANYESMRAYVGDDFEPKGAKAIGEWLRKYTSARTSMHYMHNHVVELDGKWAKMRNYMHNTNLSIGGVYYTEAKRTKDGWRLTSLRLDERFIDADRVQNPYVPEVTT